MVVHLELEMQHGKHFLFQGLTEKLHILIIVEGLRHKVILSLLLVYVAVIRTLLTVRLPEAILEVTAVVKHDLVFRPAKRLQEARENIVRIVIIKPLVKCVNFLFAPRQVAVVVVLVE